MRPYASFNYVNCKIAGTFRAVLAAVMCSLVLTTPVLAERVEPERAFDLVKGGALLLDVRSESEYASAHVPGSKLIPHTELSSRVQELGATPETPIVVYCRSGRRAEAAIKTLREKGFLNLYNAGGVADLLPAWRTGSEKETQGNAEIKQETLN